MTRRTNRHESVERLIADIKSVLRDTGRGAAGPPIARRKLRTLANRCGYRKASTVFLEGLQARMDGAGIYTDPPLTDPGLRLDDWVLLSTEWLYEHIFDEGQVVFSHSWDSGSVAGGSECTVYALDGKFVVGSMDDCSPGPFRSFKEALASNNLLVVTEATQSIRTSMLTAEELVPQLRCQVAGVTVTINGVNWISLGNNGFELSPESVT